MSDTIKAAVALVGVIVLIILIEVYPVMLLWNWLMPMIFGLPTIGFWQSLGLLVLFRLLLPTSIGKRNND